MTTMKQLTDKLKNEGGCIVASADCDTIELADARARGDFTVDDDGIGYVRRLPRWLRKHSRFARGATDSCEQKADAAEMAGEKSAFDTLPDDYETGDY